MRRLYMGPDEPPYIEHGKHYEIDVKEMKNGKKRVSFVDIGYKMTLTEDEYKWIFPNEKKRRGKKKR